MKKNYYCFISLLLIIPGFAFAQREASIWYFGKHSGISFNTTPPTILNDGMIYTDEGCATISDKEGNLQFYTDGVTIYNRNHEVIETGLFGHKSSTQSAIIVPNPADKSIFYVFTAGEGGYLYSQNGSINTAAYTIVNMCLNNGLGGVVQDKKNIILKNNVTEKLTAVLHQNGTDVWVMYHEWKSDIFSAFIVTGDGVNPNAVNSACGIVHKPYFYPDIPLNPYEYLYTTYNTLGQMKIFSSGK